MTRYQIGHFGGMSDDSTVIKPICEQVFQPLDIYGFNPMFYAGCLIFLNNLKIGRKF
jgi:hypothetical protein